MVLSDFVWVPAIHDNTLELEKNQNIFKNMVKSLSGFGEIVVEACGRAA